MPDPRFNFSLHAERHFHGLSNAYPHDDGHHRDPQKDTCGWFFNDTRAKRWRDTPHPSIIWIAGTSGVGKSVLSRAIAFHRADWLAETNQYEAPITTAYFYFHADISRRQSSLAAVCALFHQLLDKGPSPEIIDHTYARRDQGFGTRRTFKFTFESMWANLIRCASDERVGNLVCVLDSLDECNASDREQLLATIGKYVGDTREKFPDGRSSKIKFVLTSRPLESEMHRDFELMHRAAGVELVWLVDADEMGSAIREDMDVAIDSVLDLIDSEERSMVQSILRGNEQKNWLWLRIAVELIVNSRIAAKRSPSLHNDAKSLLLQFPKSVEGIYKKCLEFASMKHGVLRVKQFIHIVLGARQLLSKREILLALIAADMDFEATSLLGVKCTISEFFDIRPDIEDLLDLFDGVLVDFKSISEQMILRDWQVREFLTQQVFETSSEFPEMQKGCFNDCDAIAHYTLTRACLVFILTLKDNTNRPRIKNNRDHMDKIVEQDDTPFLRYAARYWPVHFSLQTRSDQTETLPLAQILCTVTGIRNNDWLNLHGIPKMPLNNLTIAVHVGLVSIVNLHSADNFRFLHKPSADADEQLYTCLIQLAVYNSDVNMLRFLFASGMALQEGCGCKSILIRAIETENCGLVQTLLENGVDRDYHDMGPLITACVLGCEEIVSLLLDIGFNVNGEDFNRRDALECAARGNHLGTVRVLLKRGIYFCLYGIKALLVAAECGNWEITELLLEKGLSPNIALSVHQGTPLKVALDNRHTKLAEMLVEYGARV